MVDCRDDCDCVNFDLGGRRIIFERRKGIDKK